jgi:hypothetical protein
MRIMERTLLFGGVFARRHAIDQVVLAVRYVIDIRRRYGRLWIVARVLRKIITCII